MKILIQVIFTSKKYLSLLIFVIISLFALVITNQMEMCSLGMLSRQGVDFFSLFGKNNNPISLEDVQSAWPEIAKGESSITPTVASSYLYKKKKHKLLEKLLYKFNRRDTEIETLQSTLWVIIWVAILKAICLFISRYSLQVFCIRISRDLREQYFAHIQTLPLSFYQKYNIGSLSTRIVNDSSQIARSFNSLLINYIQTPISIIASICGCLLISWQLSLIIFIGLPSLVIPIILVTKKVKKITRQLQKNQESFVSVLIDLLSGIQIIKVFRMEAFSLEKYRSQNNQMAHLEKKSAKYDLLTRPILHTVTTLCIALIFLIGLHILALELSEIIMFCGLLYLFYEPIKKFTEENMNVQKGVVAAERLLEVLQIQPKAKDHKNATDIAHFHSSLEFNNVWFRYENRWVLKNISFSIKKGEVVAIIGTTGSGKSTLVQLIPRLYEPEIGGIFIDGKPLHTYTKQSLRNIISFATQNPFLFCDTIRNNISHGNPYSMKEVEDAARQAYADEFIQDMPDKYKTLLAERGKNLSGGQKQRIAIARALVRQAPILILDEATSSLDVISEGYIKDAIRELRGRSTQIIIAHRLSTIEDADRIILLQKGEIIAQGHYKELLLSSPEFQLLWKVHYKNAFT